jgi:hypothetical protein
MVFGAAKAIVVFPTRDFREIAILLEVMNENG